MALAGAAWLTTANTLSVSAQVALPDWVRARGMSIFQMAIMGASASGAAVWGQLATMTSVPTSMLAAALTGTLAIFTAHWLLRDRGVEEDLTPSREFKVPSAAAPPSTGQVRVTVTYQIDPAKAADFAP